MIIKNIFKGETSMKKTLRCLLSVLLCVALLASITPSAVFAGDLPYNVTFKTSKGDVSVAFNSENEYISDTTNRGEPVDSGGAFDKKYFIGWSPDKNYATTNGAKLYYGNEKVERLMADGVTVVYPIFMSRLSILSALDENTATINLNKDDAATVPDSVRNKSIDTNDNDHDINLFYDETKDQYALSLESNFEMSKIFAHWLYSGNGSTIMTNTQSDKGSAAKRAKYTHVDLNITIPEEVDVPEKLNLTFSGYYFQPYMVLDTASREKFNIDEVTGTEKWNISELVTNSNPATTFTVDNPNKSRNITVRTILRSNWGYGGQPVPNISAETIEAEQMSLVANTPLTISKNKALELLNNSKKATIKGVVNGYVKLPTVIVDLSQSIKDVVAKRPVSIAYSVPMVKFDKNTAALGDTGEQNLGASKVAYNNSLAGDAFNTGAKPATAEPFGDTMADTPGTITANGVTYYFKEWNTQKDGAGQPFDENTVVTESLTVYAIFVSDEAPVLTVTDKVIKKGKSLDLKTLIVSAQDKEDGDLKDRVEITNDGGFNKNKAGVYTITFKVTDSKGQSDTKTAKVTVKADKTGTIIDKQDIELNKEEHKAYMYGYPDSTFQPNGNMTRAEVTAMFSRLLKNPPTSRPVYTMDYNDIEMSAWYYDAVGYMSEKEIIMGYEDGSFRPDQPITRAEFAAIASRFDELVGGNKTFIDVDATHWAWQVIASAAEKGWVVGYPDNTFKPDQYMTRAEIVSVTNKMLNRYADEAFIDKSQDILQFTDIGNSHWAYYQIMEATNGHDFIRESDGQTEKWTRLNGEKFLLQFGE